MTMAVAPLLGVNNNFGCLRDEFDSKGEEIGSNCSPSRVEGE